MESVIVSILTSVIGLGVGAASVVVYNNKRENNALKKADDDKEKRMGKYSQGLTGLM